MIKGEISKGIRYLSIRAPAVALIFKSLSSQIEALLALNYCNAKRSLLAYRLYSRAAKGRPQTTFLITIPQHSSISCRDAVWPYV